MLITDGGMETTLIFKQGLELPHFAAFVLLDDPEGVEALRVYYRSYIEIAQNRGVGIVLDTPTWRANPDWGEKLGYDAWALAKVNERAVALLEDLRTSEVLISGCIGPRGDGYRAEAQMSTSEAELYHTPQVQTFAGTTADSVSALTLTYAEEAIGIARAAAQREVPVVISFTVETNGRLPSGQPLGEAIEQVDADTSGAIEYFMVNCAHPTHFLDVLEPAPWLERLRGVRANASKKSHAELDQSEGLDEGDPAELAANYRELQERVPSLAVFGGCCGTDHRHIEAICAAVAS
jgi:homocysteine S-methyltransferase